MSITHPAHKTKASRNRYLLIIGVCIILFIVSASFVVVKKSRSSVDSSTNPTPVINPKTGWKTYTNERAGFSLKIPSDAQTKTRDPDPFPVAVEINSLKPRGGGGGGPELVGWLMIISEPQPNQEQLSLVQWAKAQNLFSSGSENPEQVSIAGKPAISWISPYFDSYQQFLIQRSATEVVLVLINAGRPYREIHEVFDQMLSTLQFDDEPEPCQPVEDPCNLNACGYDPAQCPSM